MADYFISDLHLSDARTDLLIALENLIKAKQHDMSSLYILGDLFDYWIGDDYQTKCSRRFAEIVRPVENIAFLAGNRDFLLGKDYAELVGMKLLDEIVTTTICGKVSILMHGDQLCTDDIEHQKSRRLFLDRQLQAQFLALPIEDRIKQAKVFRTKSEHNRETNSAIIMDTNQQTVESTLNEYGASLMIHGHTHRPKLHQLTGDKHRIVLGDWDQYGWFLRVTYGEQSSASLVRFSITDSDIREDVVATLSEH